MHSTGYILSPAISPHPPPPQQLLHHLILSPTQHNSSETEQIKWSTNFCSHLYDSSSVLCCLVSDGRRGGVSNAAVSDAIWTRHSICFVLQSSACPPSILATHSPVVLLDTIRTQIWDWITLSTTRLTMTECVVSAGRSPSRALQLRISCVHSFHRDRTRADDASSTDDEMPSSPAASLCCVRLHQPSSQPTF